MSHLTTGYPKASDMQYAGYCRLTLILIGCIALCVQPAVAKCDLDAATADMVHCRNDIAGFDPAPLLADCSKSASDFRACELDKETMSKLDVMHRDELSYYLAWALFGKAGAERHLYDEKSAIRDFRESKQRLEKVLKSGAMPERMLSTAQTMLASVDSALND